MGREGVEHGGFRIGHEDHVGLIDGFPAGDRRPVEHDTVFECAFIHGVFGLGSMLPFTPGIGETKIDVFDVVLLNHFTNFFHIGHDFSSFVLVWKNWLKLKFCSELGMWG